jgi:hypothetical protein
LILRHIIQPEPCRKRRFGAGEGLITDIRMKQIGKGNPMHDLIRTNDPVLISFVESLMRDAGIGCLVADSGMSILEGSVGVIPRAFWLTRRWPPRPAGLSSMRVLRTQPWNDRADGAAVTQNRPICCGRTSGASQTGAPSGYTIDAFHNGGFYLVQPSDAGHRAGMDAMLLAATVPDGASGVAGRSWRRRGRRGAWRRQTGCRSRYPAGRTRAGHGDCARRTLRLRENAHLAPRAGCSRPM